MPLHEQNQEIHRPPLESKRLPVAPQGVGGDIELELAEPEGVGLAGHRVLQKTIIWRSARLHGRCRDRLALCLLAGRFLHLARIQEDCMSQRSNPFRPIALVLAAALLLGSGLAAGAQEHPDSSNRTLEGTWWVHVTTLADCVSRAPLASFTALLTFADGGTMTGTTTNPGFAVGQRSPNHGVWSRRHAPHDFKVSSVALILFTTPANLPV